MNPSRFFVPRMGANLGPMMSSSYMPARGGFGFFGKIASSMKSFNWSGLLNGANKTLNVVNQTIPLVRQAGPMFNNMKSMLRLAKVFGNETTSKKVGKNNSNNITNDINLGSKNKAEQTAIKKEVMNDNYPNFFI